jgi:anti-anti-sigma factor
MTNLLTQNMDQTPVVLKVERDLVAAQSAELREQLRALVHQGARAVVLDFAQVRMVDSAGLGMIIAAHNSLKKVEGELAVTGCSTDILELFRSMRIHQHMRVEGAGVPVV